MRGQSCVERPHPLIPLLIIIDRATLRAMRKLLLLFLMLILPLQMIAAAERGITHATEGSQDAQVAMQHAIAHAEHIAHHHHSNDGSMHMDDSQASAQHLLDCEKACAMSFMLPTAHHLSFEALPQVVPTFLSEFIPERTTSPPLRPPPVALA